MSPGGIAETFGGSTVAPTGTALIRSLIRTVPDFPTPGVLFSDIAPVLASREGLAATVDAVAARVTGPVDAVVGIEARGFILGTPVAVALGAGFVPVRKPGKLPGELIEIDYALEYGSGRLCVQADAVRPGARVVIVDDVLATGGTVAAAVELMRRLGAEVVGVVVLLELTELGGRARVVGHTPLEAVLTVPDGGETEPGPA